MAKPVILTVDDDPEVLQAVARDLREEYGDRGFILTNPDLQLNGCRPKGWTLERDIIVKRHKGDIHFESKPGNTRFRVSLPIEPTTYSCKKE